MTVTLDPGDISVWKFSEVKTRYRESIVNGDTVVTVGNATDQELAIANRVNPGKVLRTLEYVTDKIRFAAGGVYQDLEDQMDAIMRDDSKTQAEKTAAIGDIKQQIREKMERDVFAGNFFVDNKGKVYHRGSGDGYVDGKRLLDQRQTGFELQALLIKKTNEEIGEINDLTEALATLDQWVQNQARENEGKAIVAFYDYATKIKQEKRRTIALGPAWHGWEGSNDRSYIAHWDSWRYPTSHKRSHGDLKKEHHVSSLDKFISDKFPSDYSGRNSGRQYFDRVRGEYENLLRNANFDLGAWTYKIDKNQENELGGWKEERKSNGNGSISGPSYQYKTKAWERKSNQQAISINTFSDAMERLRTVAREKSTTADSISTDFQSDNSRYNAVVEAMNNYHKNVANSLIRLSQ